MLRKLVTVGATCLGLSTLLAAMPATANTWPEQPVRVIVPFGPGSASDILARLIGSQLQDQLKQPLVVENKPGANGMIGTAYVAGAQPDGYTLLLSSGTVQSINPHLFKSLPFDPVADFSPMGLLSTLPYLLTVDAKLPVKSVKELMAYAKQNNRVSYAYSNGPGQIGGDALSKAIGATLTAVPYKSSPQAMSDVAGGHVSFMFTDVSSSRSFIQAGTLRPLALASSTRSSLLPDLPTMEEATGLKNFEMITWVGISGPAGVPPEIISKVNVGINKMLEDPSVREKLASLGAEPAGGTPEQFKTFMDEQLALWGTRVKEAGIKAQ